MDVHIDWLSWTEREVEAPRTAAQLYRNARGKLREYGNDTERIIFDGQGFDPTVGRAPYRVAIARDDAGARIYGSSHTDTMLVELSGRGCERIRNHTRATELLGCIADRITRIDIAVDIRTDVRPAEFTAVRSHQRYRHRSHIVSNSGETVYVGSPKSDRYARVYRYNHPHPRAELLRVEAVFRRELAKAAGREYAATQNTSKFAALMGNTFGFNHEVWRPGVQSDGRLAHPIVDRRDADTVHWIYTQVTPAIRRLMASGALDMAEWLEYVYSDRQPPR